MATGRGDQVMEENVVQLAVYLPSLPSYSKTRCEWKFEAPFWGLCLTSLRRWAQGKLAVWWSLCQSAEAGPGGSRVQVLCSMWARETQTSPSQRPGEIGSEEAFLLFFKEFNSNITFHIFSPLPEENWHSVHYLQGNVLLLLLWCWSLPIIALPTGVEAPLSPRSYSTCS